MESVCKQNCANCPYFNYIITKITLKREPILSDQWIKLIIIHLYSLYKYKEPCKFEDLHI